MLSSRESDKILQVFNSMLSRRQSDLESYRSLAIPELTLEDLTTVPSTDQVSNPVDDIVALIQGDDVMRSAFSRAQYEPTINAPLLRAQLHRQLIAFSLLLRIEAGIELELRSYLTKSISEADLLIVIDMAQFISARADLIANGIENDIFPSNTMKQLSFRVKQDNKARPEAKKKVAVAVANATS